MPQESVKIMTRGLGENLHVVSHINITSINIQPSSLFLVIHYILTLKDKLYLL